VTLNRGNLKFIVGETLVYPHHGAVTLTELTTVTLKGVEQPAMTLRVHASELTIKLPIANAELVGVRDVIDAAGLEEVYAVLREPFTEEATNWSRRFKANQEKMASDSVTRIAEVVRDLWRREHDGGVSAGEKRMLAKSRQLLESELSLALGTSPEDTVTALDDVLTGALVDAA